MALSSYSTSSCPTPAGQGVTLFLSARVESIDNSTATTKQLLNLVVRAPVKKETFEGSHHGLSGGGNANT